MVPFNVLKGSGELRINTLEKERKKEKREREERKKGRGERKGEEEGMMGEGGNTCICLPYWILFEKVSKREQREKRGEGGGRREEGGGGRRRRVATS